MLKEVLQKILSSRILDKGHLARDIGISIGTLEDMIRLLVERGLLRLSKEDNCEPVSCGGCAHTSHCATEDSGTVYYTLTERGIAYANS